LSVKLRLHRMGKKKQPFYRIVAVDSRGRRDGKYLEKIGHYNPIKEPAEIVIDKEKAMKWLDRGAIPSDTVKSFFRHQGILLEWDLRRRGFAEEKIVEELKKWEVLQLARQKRLEAKAAMQKREPEPVKEEEEKQEAEPVAEEETKTVTEEAAAEEPQQESEENAS